MSTPPTSACPCGSPQDPRLVANPPGQAQIAYRVDDFTGFRRALLRPLPGEQAIGSWSPTPGDLGLQVLEWWAYLADILTFYNERIANESYLGTAQQPTSLSNLVALIGYTPAPGLAATGQVAAVRSQAHPGEPLVVPDGMQISSTATPGIPSQVFEVDGTTSFPGPSNVAVAIPPDPWLVATDDGPQSVVLAGRVSGIKAGDELVLVETGFAGTDSNWSLVTVGTVSPVTDLNTAATNTLVTFSSGGWGPTPPPLPFYNILETDDRFDETEELRSEVQRADEARPAARADVARPAAIDVPVTTERSTVFETSTVIDAARLVGTERLPPAPSRQPLHTADFQLLRPSATAALWNHVVAGAAPYVPVETPSGDDDAPQVHLSAAVRGIAPGDLILFDGGAPGGDPAPSALAIVTATSEQLWAIPYPPGSVAPTPPDILVAHTVLSLTLGDTSATALLDSNSQAAGALAVRYAFREVGTVIAAPISTLQGLPAIVDVPPTYTPPPGGATAYLLDATNTGYLVAVTSEGPDQVTLAPAGTPLPFVFPAPLTAPLQLLLDVVDVSRGATVGSETLGSGDATLTNQSFTLSKSPLTYLASGNGWTSTLVVAVDGVEWTEVTSFYGQAPDAPVYVVGRGSDQLATVRFGDGVNGARLSSGSGNVVASYRYGSGLATPPAGRLTTISRPQPNLSSVQNPVAVTGGTDPQAPEAVRADAPASVFTFGRAISGRDYEVVASQAPGVTRASASWTFDAGAQRTLVTVYVGDAGDGSAATAATKALAGADDPNRPVAVVEAQPVPLTVSCTLVVAADRQADAVATVAAAAVGDPATGLFSPTRMGIGQRLYRSAVDAALMVDGVVAVHDLQVTQPATGVGLVELLDPGEGAFFTLAGSPTITGVRAGG